MLILQSDRHATPLCFVGEQVPHLPVVADPSHGVGISWAVAPLARASVAAGADSVMIETHPDPDHALSDGQQSLRLDEYRSLAQELGAMHAWMNSRRT